MMAPEAAVVSIAMNSCATTRSRERRAARGSGSLALLQHRGVTAWPRAWHTTAPPPAVSVALAAPVGEREIVSALATMALACAAAA